MAALHIRRPRGLRPAPVALLGPLMFGALSVLAVLSDRVRDHPLSLLTLPLVLSAVVLGTVAAGVSLVVASTVAIVWWVTNSEQGGWFGLVSWLVVYVTITVSVERVVSSRRRLARRLAAHSDLSLDLIATASFDGYFTRVNPAFTTILGFTAAELLACPLLDFVHPEDREPTLAAIAAQADEGRAVYQFRNRYRTKAGTYRWLEWTSRPDEWERELVAVARDVTDRQRLEELEQEQKALLEAAVAERTRELEEARLETLQRLALAAEYRDDQTHHHTQRVGRTAAEIAATLGWQREAIELIRLAAPLHDVGKLAISDTILLKPGPLTGEEFERMQQHTESGQALLEGSRSRVLQLAAEIAISHHERWDGRGYPHGLRGDTIPISGRIVAVADVFDALTHTRPYKEAWDVADAVDEIRRLRGSQFDPSVVEAFLTLDHESLVLEPPPQLVTVTASSRVESAA